MVNFYYKIIRRPMLMFKKEIKIEVGRRQDMEMIIAEVDNEISRAEEQYLKEFNEKSDNSSGINDATTRRVKKLEKKVNSLAKSVHELFL